jgi:ATP-dependent DNA ligase
MSRVYDVIEEMQQATGTNAKIAIMESLKLQPDLERDFLRIVVAAYSPYINFYIKKFILVKEGDGDISDPDNLIVLERLAKRAVTGNAAIKELEDMGNTLSRKSQKVLQMIIKKSFDTGTSIKSINKVWPGKIPVFNVMLCQPLNEKTRKKIVYPCYVQVKYDAARVSVIVKDSKVKYFTRNGKEYLISNRRLDNQFIYMAERMAMNGEVVFDGEIYRDGLDRVKSNSIATKFVRGTASQADSDNVSIVLWDTILFADFQTGKSDIPYGERLMQLQSIVSKMRKNWSLDPHIILAVNKQLHNIEDILEYNDKMISEGEEGVIIKNIDAGWEATRSVNTIKLKEELETELIVMRSAYGINKYKEMCGALECQSSDGLVKVSVGTGLTDKNRTDFAPDNAAVSIIGKIITVKHNGLITDKFGRHSLYLPRFVEIRFDKTAADTLPKIKSEGKRG